MTVITNIVAREILDSRGHPTIEVDVILQGGFMGRVAAPSGASKGTHEMIERRDSDDTRYGGNGVLTAVDAVNGEICAALNGLHAEDQAAIDHALIILDGTENKSRLGSNSIFAVSLAVAKAAASACTLSLYRYVGGIYSRIMPIPMMNILNGGIHADNLIDIQEFMIMPVGVERFQDALRAGSEIFHTLKKMLKDAGHNTNVGDEGGFAPNLRHSTEILEFIVQSIEKSGYRPGEDIFIALDVAATELYDNEKYRLNGEDKIFCQNEMIDYLADLARRFPIISIEDGMAEDDWDGWSNLTSRLGTNCQLVGDDIFVTNSRRLQVGIDRNIANAILVKVNQIGTLTETLDTVEMAHRSSYKTIMSHRSGETEDTTIADLAVAIGCGQVKLGSTSRSDRLAKYNQLLRIEEELGDDAVYANLKVIRQG